MEQVTLMKKKVLILIYGLRRGGMEMVATSLQLNMSPDKYEFIYYVQDATNNDRLIEASVLESGAKVVAKPKEVKSRYDEYKFLKKLIKDEKIDIVHDHMLFHGGLSARAGYKAGAKKRIAHSHLREDNRKIGLSGKLYRCLMHRWLYKYATDRLACSKESGIYLYGKKFLDSGTVLVNGIDTEKYKFDTEKRKKMRAELGIENKLVIGHIGLIYWIKNQTFLIKVFNELLKKRHDSVLLICGEFRDGGECERLVKALGIEDKVMFLGTRSDIPELLAAMDILVFPSVCEAFPLVPVEAQASKLPCLISDRVTTEVKANENVSFLPLEVSMNDWVDEILRTVGIERESIDIQNFEKKFDIKNITEKLEKIYG